MTKRQKWFVVWVPVWAMSLMWGFGSATIWEGWHFTVCFVSGLCFLCTAGAIFDNVFVGSSK